MQVLALDLSHSTGYAVLDSTTSKPSLVEFGLVEALPLVPDQKYPWNYLWRITELTDRLAKMVERLHPDQIVIEETNIGRSRYSQKLLEWIHQQLLLKIMFLGIPVAYVNTSDWRRKLGATLTKDDKKLNAKVRKLKKSGDKEGLRKLGVRGKIGKKHVAIRFVNEYYGLGLRMKDNDTADAIALGTAFCLGVPTCDGK